MRIRAGLITAIVVVASVLAVLIRPPISEPALAHELIRMEREANEPIDAGVRGFIGAFDQDDARLQEYNRRQEIRAARFKAIIDRYGWPTKKMVGREGVYAAVRQLDRMRDRRYVSSVLPQVLKTADHTPELAYLVDLVAVELGEPQTFGTQAPCREGFPVEVEIKDRANLEARRREFGLPPSGFDREAREGFCTDSFEPAPDSRVITQQ